jgi:PEGA domain
MSRRPSCCLSGQSCPASSNDFIFVGPVIEVHWRGLRSAIRRMLPVLALWLLTAIAAAQPKTLETSAARSPDAGAEQSRVKQARESFERGLLLAHSSDTLAAALAEFQASRELYPTRSATRNAAIILHQLRRFAEAAEAYRALLERYADVLPPEQLEEAKLELSKLLQKVGRLEVRANEAGATVIIDGQQRGTTGLTTGLLVDPGPHTVRLAKPGFETTELAVAVEAGETVVATLRLRHVAETGNLFIVEDGGGNFDVIVDSAVVGETPWRGTVSVGRHTVLLRRGLLGTPPSTVEAKAGETATLTLRAVALDAEIRIVPVPSNANVIVDGVSVGSGIWVGKLPAGTHRLEVVAPQHLPLAKTVVLQRGKLEVVTVNLERDLSQPLFGARARSQFYAEVNFSGLLARSFGGSADVECACSSRSRPRGAMAGVLLGYLPIERLGLELFAGYLTMTERMTRSVAARLDDRDSVTLDDYRDSTTLFGPALAVGGSYRWFERFPLTARASFGLSRLDAHTNNSSNYSDEAGPIGVTALELQQRLLTPFLGSEVRLGYQVSKLLRVDVGFGVALFLPPEMPRVGTSNQGTARKAALPNGAVLKLPPEVVADSFVVFSPSVALRLAF